MGALFHPPAVGSGFPEPRWVPPTAPPRRPRCLLGALTAALALSLVLCVSWWVAERAQPEATSGWGNTSLGPPCASLDGTFRELRRILCPPREAEGCRLCPVGWMLGRTKCYWVSERMNSWPGSREDCGDRGAAMAMPWDKDELVPAGPRGGSRSLRGAQGGQDRPPRLRHGAAVDLPDGVRPDLRVSIAPKIHR
ncbi:uncharacterized protein LOC113988448 isoform X2 [Pipra filicauda]|uniref:Uncharacterized protein LOC113988448 isoform X2 n=1 Tax=Pipra filicauda TaxID=649802 RepID=A0A7R5KXK3_9PASS|nr:uncharacterized protein LOC113988448 isoform X2 [Pipra filicauda]